MVSFEDTFVTDKWNWSHTPVNKKYKYIIIVYKNSRDS